MASDPVLTASAGVHRTHLVVRFAELDPYSHVNHAVYVGWCEAGRCEALADVGMALQDLSARGLQLVVTDLQVKFKRSAVAGDRIVIETWLSELGAVRSTWNQRVLRESAAGGQEVLCELEVRAGSTDTSGRPLRLPSEVRTALHPLLVELVH
jgi:acyl-CoA thioester hydrolase